MFLVLGPSSGGSGNYVAEISEISISSGPVKM